VTLVAALGAVAATGPYWWYDRGVVDTNNTPNDHAVANQGQAKWIATNAAVVMWDYLPGGAGAEVSNLVAGFTTAGNWLPLNHGQLKTLAKPFYDRIAESGVTGALPSGAAGPYPWTTTTNDDANYAVVNIGQVKYAFSFDLDKALNIDRDADGLPDWWEGMYFRGLIQGPSGDPDEDGLSNMTEYLLGSGQSSTFNPNSLCVQDTGGTVGLLVFTPME
jgi:hypothetical protein